MASDTSSVLARQPSGIRAVPSNDDDDDDVFDDDFDANYVDDYETDNSVNGFAKVDDNCMNLSMSNYNSSSNSSSQSSESSTMSTFSGSNTSFSSGNTGSLVNGGEEFESDPGKESQQNMVGVTRNGVLGTRSVGGSPRVPVAKVSGEGDDVDEIEVGEEDDGQVEGSYGAQKVMPRVRVLDEDVDEEGVEEWGDVVEGPKGETPNGNVGGGEVRGVESSEVGSGAGKVEEDSDVVASSASEGNYIKDSTYADVVVSGNAAAEDKEGLKEPAIGGGIDETLAVETASSDTAVENVGVKFTDEGDAVVDTVNVDAAEAVRSGTAVVEGTKVETPEGNEGERENGPKLENPKVNEGGKGEEGAVESMEVVSTDEGGSVKVSTYAEVAASGNAPVEDREDVKEFEVGGENEGTPIETASADPTANVGSAGEGGSVKVSTYAEVASSGSAPVEDRENGKESEVRGENEETRAVETASADPTGNVGAKYTNEGDAVVDSINVDAVEAVRSGTAVVGELEETKDSKAELEKSVVGELEETKDSKAELEKSVVENDSQVVENSVADDFAPEDSKLIDDVKSSGEGDSVVDSINVDVDQVVQSGVAAVGDFEVKGTESEVKKDSPSAAEDVTSTNDFAPLAAANSSEIDDVGGEQQNVTQTDEAEAPKPVESVEQHNTEETKVGTDLQAAANSSEIDDVGGEQQNVTQTDEAEAPKPVESVEQHDTEETKVGTDLQNKQLDPTDEQLSNSGGKNEKAQPLDDKSDEKSTLVDADIKDRSYANDLHNAAASDVPSPAYGIDAEDEKLGAQEEGDDEGLDMDEEDQLDYFGTGSSSNKIIEELESRDRSEIDGQVVTDSEYEGESDEEGEGKELFDSAAFAALLKAATSAGSDPGTITISSQDGSRLFSVERPAGLGPSLRSVRPASGPRDSNFISPSRAAAPSEDNLSEEEKNKLQKLQQLKVKFLRLVQRVGFTAENSIAAQVLYKLSFFGGRSPFPAFSLDNAKQTAMQLEAEGKDDLNFSLTILVLGKTGVGKSAVINSIFLEEKVKINAFEPETTSVTEICGTVDGVNIRFIEVPGLKSSASEQGYNRKVLDSVKKITKKHPVDVVFYVDRLDSQIRDLNDLPMLRTITASLGSSIWRNTIITLTHASSAPPDGPSGTPLSYEVFVAQRSHIVQQSIGQAVGDLRLMNLNMMSPVSLVENHPACRKNREGQKILPNGQAWRPQLLVLCYSVKILSEATSTAKPQDPFDSRKLFGFRVRSPPLPYLLSSLLQPRTHPKLSADQGGDSVDSDIDLDDLSDSDQEEEVDEYDQLPPFKPLRKSQIAKLSGEQKKAYFEEYDYRVKLLQQKQWKEELKRMREMKKGKSGMGAYVPEDYDGENGDGENGAPAAVPVPLPDMALPPSFDSDNPAYRYRFLEPTSQFLARPVLDTHGWDHDCGYDGVNVEQNLGIAGRFPASVTAQVTKDKKDFNVHLDSAVAVKHGENGSSLVGFDVQSIGKQYAYIIKGESKFKNLKKNKTTAGVSVTFLGENVASGVKVEDQITLGKRLVLVGSTGTVRSQKDAAYGANLEVRLRDADYPIGQEQSSFTLSLMKWRGDLAIGGNLQSQISVGRNSKMALRVALNNKQSGQITMKTSSSDHISLAIAGLLPIALSIYQKFKPGVSESYSIY